MPLKETSQCLIYVVDDIIELSQTQKCNSTNIVKRKNVMGIFSTHLCTVHLKKFFELVFKGRFTGFRGNMWCIATVISFSY